MSTGIPPPGARGPVSPATVASPPLSGSRAPLHDAGLWAALVACGLLVSALAVAVDARLGTASAPFTGEYRFKLEIGSLLAPAVAAGVVAAVRRGLHERLAWSRVLLLGYLASVAWALSLAVVDGGNGLASPVTNPDEYLRDVPAVGDDPGGFLETFVGRSGEYSVATRQHPPGPVLLLWALGQVGVTRPAVLGTVLTLVGCASVPLVAVAVRSLCGAPAARRLLPYLVLAPYAVWLAVSMDAVTTTLCAAFVACGVVGSEPRRTPWWAAAAGALLGVAALFSYAAPWLAGSVLATYFVRRRPLLNILGGVAALVPLLLVRLAGFVWPDGLSAAQADFSLRVEPNRSALLWAFLNLVILLIACGPAGVAALRKIRRTPGWPFLVGAGFAVGFAVASGLARGEVERSWLPFFPWLLVPVVAPERRHFRPDRAPATGPDRLPEGPTLRPPPAASAPTSVVLLGLAAATAIVIESVLRTTW